MRIDSTSHKPSFPFFPAPVFSVYYSPTLNDQYATDYVDENSDVHAPESNIVLKSVPPKEASRDVYPENPDKGIYEVNDDATTKTYLLNQIKSNTKSSPNTVVNLIKRINIDVSIVPTYRIEYKISHKTVNSSNKLLYNVNKVGVIHIDATNLKIFELPADYLYNATILSSSNHIRLKKSKPTYLNDDRRTINPIKNHLKRKYSQTVSYVGGNNVTYSRYCEILDKEIFILNTTPVYLPLQKVYFKIFFRNYTAEFIEKKQYSPLILSKNYNQCHICHQETELKQVCNSCGSITHPQIWSKRKSHGYTCDKCGKTICRRCAYWSRKYLFFKEVLCYECVKSQPGTSNKYAKIPDLTNTISDYFL